MPFTLRTIKPIIGKAGIIEGEYLSPNDDYKFIYFFILCSLATAFTNALSEKYFLYYQRVPLYINI